MPGSTGLARVRVVEVAPPIREPEAVWTLASAGSVNVTTCQARVCSAGRRPLVAARRRAVVGEASSATTRSSASKSVAVRAAAVVTVTKLAAGSTLVMGMSSWLVPSPTIVPRWTSTPQP